MGLTEAMEAGCRGCGGHHKTGKVGVLLLQQNHWEKFFPGNACSLRGHPPAYSFSPFAPPVQLWSLFGPSNYCTCVIIICFWFLLSITAAESLGTVLRDCYCQAVSIPRPTPSAPLAPPYCVYVVQLWSLFGPSMMARQITVLVWL